MQIYDKRLDEIKPYENNPRNNDNAVDAVANSIREFGFKVPLVVDSEGVIVAGHTRYKAAQKLGLQTVPCLIADDLSDEQVKAFRLADNKVGELATWDLDTLRVELDNIGEIDMSEFGFSLDDLAEELPINDDDIDEKTVKEHRLTIDHQIIPLTDDEYNDLMEEFGKYVENNGVAFGFGRWLLCNMQN